MMSDVDTLFRNRISQSASRRLSRAPSIPQALISSGTPRSEAPSTPSRRRKNRSNTRSPSAAASLQKSQRSGGRLYRKNCRTDSELFRNVFNEMALCFEYQGESPERFDHERLGLWKNCSPAQLKAWQELGKRVRSAGPRGVPLEDGVHLFSSHGFVNDMIATVERCRKSQLGQ